LTAESYPVGVEQGEVIRAVQDPIDGGHRDGVTGSWKEEEEGKGRGGGG